MISYVYCYRNLKAGFYTAPVCNQFDKEKIIEQTQRTFILNKGTAEHEQQKEVDLYFLGLFDDKSGAFQLLEKPEYLCSFTEVEEAKKDE